MSANQVPSKPQQRVHETVARGLGFRGLSMLGLLVLLVLVLITAASLGTLEIDALTTLRAVWAGLHGQQNSLQGLEAIVWNLRLPRVVFGALVGATLAVAGAAMQGLFRNPLADPYLTGTASGAAFGATVAIFALGSPSAAFAKDLMQSSHLAATNLSGIVPVFAFVGAFGAVMLSLWLSRLGSRQHGSGAALVLSGVVVGGMLTSITTFIQMRDADRMRAVFSWTLGNLSLSGWSEVLLVLPYVLLGLLGLLACARALDALQLGDDTARSLGVRVETLGLIVVLLSSLATAGAVAFAGIIGFVGLVAPHLMRRLVGPAHRLLIPSSALAGAILLVISDLLARTLTRPEELPVGVVTTLLGGPFFLWLLQRKP